MWLKMQKIEITILFLDMKLAVAKLIERIGRMQLTSC